MPNHDDRHLFEMLVLEGAQAGLSWITILRKREHFRKVFDGFKPDVIASYTPEKIEALMADPGIVRNRAKITAAIGNARAWLELDDPVAHLWQFVAGVPVQNDWQARAALPASTEASERMSRDLKRRGFRFVGPTICYALMQACGMVNDHVVTCFRHREVAALA